jgi:Zn-dependent protease with chaperone function
VVVVICGQQQRLGLFLRKGLISWICR